MTALTMLFSLLPILVGIVIRNDVMKIISVPMAGGVITSLILELTLYRLFSFSSKRNEKSKC